MLKNSEFIERIIKHRLSNYCSKLMLEFNNNLVFQKFLTLEKIQIQNNKQVRKPKFKNPTTVKYALAAFIFELLNLILFRI